MLNSIELHSWRQHRRLEINFKAGLNGILGPNGMGKSNLLDGIRFADTGESVSDGNVASFITWGEESCWVKTSNTVGAYDFTIKRTINSKGKTTVQLKVKGGGTFDKAGEVSDELDRIYGANKAARLNNVYIPQGRMDAILYAKPSERYAEFQKTFSMDNLKKAHDWLKVEINNHNVTPDLDQLLSAAVVQLEEARTAGHLFESHRLTVQSEIDALTPAEAVIKLALEAIRSQQAVAYATNVVRDALRELRTAEEESADAIRAEATQRATVDAMRPQVREVEASITATEAAHAAYERGKTHRAALAADEGARSNLAAKPTEADWNAIVQRVSDCSGAVHRTAAILANPPQLPQELVIAEKRVAAKAELQSLPNDPPLNQEGVGLLFEAEALGKHLELVKQGKCPTCGSSFQDHNPAAMEIQLAGLRQALTTIRAQQVADLAAQKQALTALITQATVDLAQFTEASRQVFTAGAADARALLAKALAEQKAMESLIKGHVTLEQRIAQAQAALSDTPTEAPDISGLPAKKEFILNFRQAELEVHTLVTKKAMAQSVLNGATSALTVAQANLANVGAALDAPTEEAVAKAKADIDILVEKRKELAEVLQQVGINQALTKQCEAEVTRLRDRILREGQAAQWIEQIKIARDALHVQALPALAMREFARILNVRTEYYLRLWESPFSMWLDDDMAFQVEFEGKGRCTAGDLSGGQKMFASTSFRLAMSDTFASSVGLLVLDEPGAYLDKQNMHLLQMLVLKLKEMSAHSTRQILIVHHGDELGGFLDHVVQIA